MPLSLSKRWALARIALFGESRRAENLLQIDQALRDGSDATRAWEPFLATRLPGALLKPARPPSLWGESFPNAADYELAQRWSQELGATVSRFENWKSQAKIVDAAARARLAPPSGASVSAPWGSSNFPAGAQNSLLGMEHKFNAAMDRLAEKAARVGTHSLRSEPPAAISQNMERAGDYGVLAVLARQKLIKFCRGWRDFVNGGPIGPEAANGSADALRAIHSPDLLRQLITLAGPQAARATVGDALLSDIVAFFVEFCERAEARSTRALAELARELVSTTLSLPPCNPAEQMPYSLFSEFSPRASRSFLLQKIILAAPGLDLSPSALGPELFRKAFVGALQALWTQAVAQDQANNGAPDPKSALTTRAQREEFSFLIGTAPWGLHERVDPDFAASFFSDRPVLAWLSKKTPPPELIEMANRAKPATVKEWLSLFLASDGIPCPLLSADAQSLLHLAHESMAALDEQRQLKESMAQAEQQRRTMEAATQKAEPGADSDDNLVLARPRVARRI